jgi:adenine-specific DNA-methyltransferase
MSVSLHWPGKENWTKNPVKSGFNGSFLSGDVLIPNPTVLEWLNSQHCIFLGDNLPVLNALRTFPSIRFDLIYIDPPYNTQSNQSYSDSLPSALWLDFMYARIQASHALLEESGFLFVSIDDHQVSELTVLLKEVFGAENHVGTFKWKRKRKPSFLSKKFATMFEYIVVFSKNVKKRSVLLGSSTSHGCRPVLNASNKPSQRCLHPGMKARCPDGVYPPGIYGARTLQLELLDPLEIVGSTVKSITRVVGKFRVSQEILDQSGFVTRSISLRRTVQASEHTSRKVCDFNENWPTNEVAQNETKKLFGEIAFHFAKPVGLLKSLLQMVKVPSHRPMRCLDFFAGTGTFGQAVLELNSQDSAKRLCVMIQSKEPILKPKDSLSEYHFIHELLLKRMRTVENNLWSQEKVMVLELVGEEDLPH